MGELRRGRRFEKMLLNSLKTPPSGAGGYSVFKDFTGFIKAALMA